jgi:hypothetical protein
MPFTYVFDAATNIVRTSAQGLVRFDDLAAHLQALMDAGVARVPQLIDARDAQHDLSASDIRRLVELVSHLQAAYGFSRRTALVVSTPMDFGMARMYGALAQKVDPDFSVFRDLGEAEAWLQGAR